jgi:hypothetical protein
MDFNGTKPELLVEAAFSGERGEGRRRREGRGGGFSASFAHDDSIVVRDDEGS